MIRRLLKWLLLVSIVPIAWIGWLVWDGNFHPVIDGEVYRSAQLSADQLERRLEAYHIRSVLNLRGAAPHKQWYQEELAVTARNGAEHADFEIWSGAVQDEASMQKLVALMERLPKPMLIHCYGGADRSGLASALYLYAIKHQPAESAAGQLTALYGHIPYLMWADKIAMDQSFEAFIADSAKQSTLPAPRN